MRKSIEETWNDFETRGFDMPRDSEGRPFIPPCLPNDDDETPGFSFFRTQLSDEDLGGFQFPRTFFGRSLCERVSFNNSDLSESRMCWNDFVECDFSSADLTKCDLRATNFTRCRFVGASLRTADLRRGAFDECDFHDADLDGALAERGNADGCVAGCLTAEQLATMIRSDDGGPDPPGG